MKTYQTTLHEMKPFLMLWGTQAFSALGSAMTSYALVIWSYTQKQSALMDIIINGLLLCAICHLQHFCRGR